ncbi:MAG: S53 family peptidase [Rhizomicrobium sp.]|jgi:subtilase family serine protease
MSENFIGCARRVLPLFVASVAVSIMTAATPAFSEGLLTTHVPKVVAQHEVRMAGRPNPNTPMFVDIALPMRNQGQLHDLIKQLYNPKSPQYRHYLSVAQFTERFGPTKSDYDAAVKFFSSSGIEVKRTSANRHMILGQGRVADVERVFHVKLNLYKHPTENRNFMAPDREPTLDFNVPVLHVSGLDDYILPQSHLIHRNAATAGRSGTDVCDSGTLPYNYIGSDMRAAYYGGSTLTGSGQSLALVALNHGWDPNSISTYFSCVGQTNSVPIYGVSVDTTPVNCTNCNDDEQALDIEYSISMAPGLNQVQVYVANHANVDELLNEIAYQDTSQEISTSFGWAYSSSEDSIFAEMAAQGQSFLSASGDSCNINDGQVWPADSANVTGVGGTTLTTTGLHGGSWSSEVGWYTAGYGGSMGGPSPNGEAIPSYQTPFINDANDGSTTLRNVPDVAANADYNMYECYNSPEDGSENLVCNGGNAGTSFASPMWTGFIALVNQQATANGDEAVGFLNPTLYGIEGEAALLYDPTILHDETTPQCHNKYSAVPGYDLMTGFGSPKGQALIDALAPAP